MTPNETSDVPKAIIIPINRQELFDPSGLTTSQWLLADDVYLTLEAYAASLIDIPLDDPAYPLRRRIADEMFAMAHHLRTAP